MRIIICAFHRELICQINLSGRNTKKDSSPIQSSEIAKDIQLLKEQCSAIKALFESSRVLQPVKVEHIHIGGDVVAEGGYKETEIATANYK